jgi:hypothetical protein
VADRHPAAAILFGEARLRRDDPGGVEVEVEMKIDVEVEPFGEREDPRDLAVGSSV